MFFLRGSCCGVMRGNPAARVTVAGKLQGQSADGWKDVLVLVSRSRNLLEAG